MIYDFNFSNSEYLSTEYRNAIQVLSKKVEDKFTPKSKRTSMYWKEVDRKEFVETVSKLVK